MNTEIGNKTTYKSSFLGLIPEDWEVENLESISLRIGDGLHGTPNYVSDSEYYFVNGNNLKNGVVEIDSNTKKVSVQEYDKHKKSLDSNSLLLSINGTIGNLSYCNNEKIVLGKSAAYINCKPENVNYIYYYLQSPKVIRFFENELTGSTIRNLSLKTIRETPILLPPLPEQTAIANCLSTWDKAIAAQTQLIAQKELRKKALMQQLLSGKKRLKGFIGEWKEVMLKDIFERITTKNTEVNTNVVTISAQRGFIRQGDYFNKIVASDILDNYFLVKKGDFCYNKSYSNGYPWGATKRLKDFEKAVVTTLYICFRIKNESKGSGEFFEQFFEANSLDRGLTKIAHEGGRAHGLLNVTPNDFFGLKINVPEINEQTAIANILQCADEEIQLLKKKLQQLKDQKKGLMQILLTGKKRLKY